jgi:hypothetical protein
MLGCRAGSKAVSTMLWHALVARLASSTAVGAGPDQGRTGYLYVRPSAPLRRPRPTGLPVTVGLPLQGAGQAPRVKVEHPRWLYDLGPWRLVCSACPWADGDETLTSATRQPRPVGSVHPGV